MLVAGGLGWRRLAAASWRLGRLCDNISKFPVSRRFDWRSMERREEKRRPLLRSGPSFAIISNMHNSESSIGATESVGLDLLHVGLGRSYMILPLLPSTSTSCVLLISICLRDCNVR